MPSPSTVVPVILSGGFGTRLWPASRRRQPKQLLPLVDDRTLFRSTLDRVGGISGVAPPVILCNEDQEPGIQRDLAIAGSDAATVILEPVGRNTAPAVAVAALELAMRDEDPLLLVLPADHVIRNEEGFTEAVELATWFADRNYLVTFGISPTHPETGYGYIRFGKPLAEGVREVKEFKEKPDRRTAEEYVVSGRYLWNSGMFLFKATTYLDELGRYNPEIVTAAKAALDNAQRKENTIRLDEASFIASPRDSIDYAVMEHTESAAVVPIHAGWSDVGTWSALYDLAEKDDDGNVITGDVELLDVSNSYVRSGGRLVAAIGLDGVVLVDTRDAVLVAKRDRAQDVKTILERLQRAHRPETETDGAEQRPWGRFVTVEQGRGERGPGFRVLRLWIDPGAKTSLQTHPHRSEHWIVVSGTARATIGNTTRLVPSGDSVFIPHGEPHRLENGGEETLEVIEIDLGNDTGEGGVTKHVHADERAERPG